jgi:hypothetical protein
MRSRGDIAATPAAEARWRLSTEADLANFAVPQQ